MAQQSFLREILARIAGAGRGRPKAAEDSANRLVSPWAQCRKTFCARFMTGFPVKRADKTDRTLK
jgi:hypothetical protein